MSLNLYTVAPLPLKNNQGQLHLQCRLMQLCDCGSSFCSMLRGKYMQPGALLSLLVPINNTQDNYLVAHYQ